MSFSFFLGILIYRSFFAGLRLVVLLVSSLGVVIVMAASRSDEPLPVVLFGYECMFVWDILG